MHQTNKEETMKILWISGICWNNNGGYRFPLTMPGAVSGSFFQQSIIEGMEASDKNVEVTLLTEYCSDFKKVIPGFHWSHNGISKDVSVKVVQLPVVNRISKTLNLKRAYKIFLSKEQFDVAIVYNIHTPYLETLKWVKKFQPSIKSVLIVPDLVEFTDVDLAKKPVKKVLKKIDNQIIYNLYNLIDGFVLFTESMKEKLPINGRPYTIIEGVYASNGLEDNHVEKKRAVMYAGSIPFGFGIENIVAAMDMLKDSNISLWVFGNGPMKEYLCKAEKQNSNIKYFGFVQREKLYKYEQEATILINARNSDDEFTKYSFPSKMFEYLASGTPFLTTMLQGIPKEYEKYLFVLRDNSPSEIANNIKSIFEMDEGRKEKKCQDARRFVIQEKNKYVQAKKLLKFIEKLQVNYDDNIRN